MNNKDKWLYQVFWGVGYSNIESSGKQRDDYCKMSIVWLEFFTESNGYNKHEINRVKRLELGESFMILQDGIQTIVRMR